MNIPVYCVKEQDTEHYNVNTKRYLPKFRELSIDTAQSLAGRSAKYKAEYISQNTKSDQYRDVHNADSTDTSRYAQQNE